jgi:hypothetical protein
MILTDGTHLVSDHGLEELHNFAQALSLPRRYFQDHRIPHYDIFGAKASWSARHGARLVTTRALVRRAIRKEPPTP